MHTIIYSPEAAEQLTNLYRYIAAHASANIAKRYTDALVDHCETLAVFPNRAVLREDIRSGLRLTHYKKRTMIAFSVFEKEVHILGFFYGGQDYESLLKIDDES
jgi:toxin ParE1/3/4